MPFTLNNFFNAASAALPQGMNIGMQNLAEMQRRKELADEIARQQELQAFNQRMAQQQFQRQRELDSYNQAQDALARQDANYRADTDAVYRDTKLRTDLEQQLIDNNLAKRELGMRENVANAQIANYQEPNNRWAAGAGGNSSDGTQRDYMLEQIQKQAHTAALSMSQDMMGNIDPVKYQQLYTQMYEFFQKQQPQPPQPAQPAQMNDSDGVTEEEAFDSLKQIIDSGGAIDWPATMAKYPSLNWAKIKAAFGVQ